MHGYLKSERIKNAMLKIPREDFILALYRDFCLYRSSASSSRRERNIIMPSSLSLFYEAMRLDKRHKFLESGLGSSYGAVLARDIAGSDSHLVVSVEIDPLTFEFAGNNLRNAGYDDIVLVRGDGGLGYPEMSLYHRICITAACIEITPPLLNHLKTGRKLICPLIKMESKTLFHLKKERRILQDGLSVRC